MLFSLWGLQFKYLEDSVTKDVRRVLTLALEAHSGLEEYKKASHQTDLKKQEIICNFKPYSEKRTYLPFIASFVIQFTRVLFQWIFYIHDLYRHFLIQRLIWKVFHIMVKSYHLILEQDFLLAPVKIKKDGSNKIGLI